MVGRELTSRYPEREHNIGDEILFEAKDWTVYHPIYTDKCVVENVSFNVKRGEVVGFSGLQGAGRTELAMSLFGRSYGSRISGREFINGHEVHLHNEKDAIRNGLAYVTEDRKTNGLVLSDNIARNTTMARLEKVTGLFNIVDVGKETKAAEDYVKAMRTKTPSIQQDVGNLSGGKAVIMISSELPELLGMSDRIYIMNEGRMVGELETKDATQEKIMSIILKSEGCCWLRTSRTCYYRMLMSLS